MTKHLVLGNCEGQLLLSRLIFKTIFGFSENAACICRSQAPAHVLSMVWIIISVYRGISLFFVK